MMSLQFLIPPVGVAIFLKMIQNLSKIEYFFGWYCNKYYLRMVSRQFYTSPELLKLTNRLAWRSELTIITIEIDKNCWAICVSENRSTFWHRSFSSSCERFYLLILVTGEIRVWHTPQRSWGEWTEWTGMDVFWQKNSCFPTWCHAMSHDVTQKKER